MARVQHPTRAPDIPQLLDILHAHGIRYVLIGSVAAQLYGVELQPGDLDITPALEYENLCRLVAVLKEIEAIPEGSAGHWQIQPDGEKKWVEEELTAEVRAAQAAWVPNPNDITTLDYLFLSHYGNFDVVPELTGTYEKLIKRAVAISAYGHIIWVAHIDELLAALTVPRRKKDVPRVQQLRSIQRQQGK